ncbi:ATP synthase F1 subunit gamma [Clostridium rectalis]|uniref:ATP synthase F1 subunit gamma n=1 Tax=Clostridium rectalis TaxID=2040295 RepID=UPI000F64507A|nr:ATP synthase F1 subunit gamma [Clostridium rectalis]
MAATGLIGIKRRIKSVTNTQKITRAMGLVATAKLRKCRERLDENSKYHAYFEEIKDNVVASMQNKSIYIDDSKNGKNVYLTITSNLGLCGGYNINVVSETINQIQDKNNSIVLVVGKKGKSYFNKFKINVDKEFLSVSELPDLQDVKDISNELLQMFQKEDIASVNVVYTKFISTIKQKVEVERLYPMKLSKEVKYNNFEFEISTDELLEQMVQTYTNEKILYFLLNSKVAEQASRMTAMDGATKNAGDLLDKLNTQYNRIRQSAITEEISEIIGGAEAQK